jgi:hypothetical protein
VEPVVLTGKGAAMLGLMILVSQITNVAATTFFALSGETHSVKRFIIYQIIGGLFGLGINRSRRHPSRRARAVVILNGAWSQQPQWPGSGMSKATLFEYLDDRKGSLGRSR